MAVRRTVGRSRVEGRPKTYGWYTYGQVLSPLDAWEMGAYNPTYAVRRASSRCSPAGTMHPSSLEGDWARDGYVIARNLLGAEHAARLLEVAESCKHQWLHVANPECKPCWRPLHLSHCFIALVRRQSVTRRVCVQGEAPAARGRSAPRRRRPRSFRRSVRCGTSTTPTTSSAAPGTRPSSC